MNRYRELFEKYKKGALEEARIEELHQSLVEIYFRSPAELNRDELEYTEDLVIELFASDKLKDNYTQQFKETIAGNTILQKKYHLLRDLGKATDKAKNNQIALLLDSANTELDKKEEEQLAQVLQEVIEKVHTEKETGQAKAVLENFFLRINAFFRNLIPPVHIHQPQVRMALAFTSIIIIAGIVWISIKPENKKLISDNSQSDSVKNNQVIKTDSGQRKEIKMPQRIPPVNQKPQYASADSIKNRHIPKDQYVHRQLEADTSKSPKEELELVLLAYADDIPASIEYVELRSVSSAANDLFINAAEKYESKEYDSCIIILRGLLSKNYFTSPDTINEINFYMGISFLVKGFHKPNRKLLQLSIQAFMRIDQNSSYFNDSRWYSALADIRMGNKTKGLRILDSLLQVNYVRSGEVKTLRDRMVRKTHQ